MKRVIAILAFSLITVMGYGQALPVGSVPFGTQLWIAPDGGIWTGTGNNGFKNLITMDNFTLQGVTHNGNETDTSIIINNAAGLLVTGASPSDTSLLSIYKDQPRFIFIPSLSATRMGFESNSEWDADSIGVGSTVIGHGSAKGLFSTAIGGSATGDYSVSIGLNNVSSGTNSIAIGGSNISSGQNSVAIGGGNESSGVNTFAAGHNSKASTFYSIAMGWEVEAHGDGSVALGEAVTAAHSGVFIAGDNIDIPRMSSDIGQQFKTRYHNGYKLNIAADSTVLEIKGIPNGGTVHSYNSLIVENESDLEVKNSNRGLILKSPDGTRWRITVDNSGNLQTTEL